MIKLNSRHCVGLPGYESSSACSILLELIGFSDDDELETGDLEPNPDSFSSDLEPKLDCDDLDPKRTSPKLKILGAALILVMDLWVVVDLLLLLEWWREFLLVAP